MLAKDYLEAMNELGKAEIAVERLTRELRAAQLQIDAMRPVVEAAIMWANMNNNVTDTVPWLERAVLAYKDATEKPRGECVCGGDGNAVGCIPSCPAYTQKRKDARIDPDTGHPRREPMTPGSPSSHP